MLLMLMLDLIAVASGGAIGTLARFLLSHRLNTRYRADNVSFPLGTFTINVFGCLCLGILVCFTMPAELQVFLVPGVLGAFTTFSAWMVEAVKLGKKNGSRGAWYVCVTFVAGVIAFVVGLALGHFWVG